MIMNLTGRTISVPFTYNGEIIECTSEYTYLGTYFTASGSFQRATEDLYKKGLKAYFKMLGYTNNGYASTSTTFHLFDKVVKPILLYASEIWGPCIAKPSKLKLNDPFSLEEAYESLSIEKSHLMMCRSILGVNSKVTKMSLYSDAGRYPLYLDAVCNSLKYLNRIESGNCSKLLQEALALNKELTSSGKQCRFPTS
jgi:hypothetical protein